MKNGKLRGDLPHVGAFYVLVSAFHESNHRPENHFEYKKKPTFFF